MQPGKIWLIFKLNTGHIGKSIRPKGFESIKLTFRIWSLYTKTGVSLITAGYHKVGGPDLMENNPTESIINRLKGQIFEQ